MNHTTIPNFHVLKVSVLPWTNTKPARVKILSERFKQSVTVSFDNEPGDASPTIATAAGWLKANGFNVIGKAEGKDCYYIITDTFEPLKELKNA